MIEQKTRVLTDQNGHTLRVIDSEFYALQAKCDEQAQYIRELERDNGRLQVCGDAACVRLKDVAAERDALAAQVDQIKKAVESLRSAPTPRAFGFANMTEQKAQRSAWVLINEATSATPEQCLAAHDAEVAANAVLDYNLQLRKDLDDKLPVRCIGVHGDEYAAQLHAKAAK